MRDNASGIDGRAQATTPAYEAPVVVPIGNLNDLLAGDNGTNCDALTAQATGGHDSPNCG